MQSMRGIIIIKHKGAHFKLVALYSIQYIITTTTMSEEESLKEILKRSEAASENLQTQIAESRAVLAQADAFPEEDEDEDDGGDTMSLSTAIAKAEDTAIKAETVIAKVAVQANASKDLIKRSHPKFDATKDTTFAVTEVIARADILVKDIFEKAGIHEKYKYLFTENGAFSDVETLEDLADLPDAFIQECVDDEDLHPLWTAAEDMSNYPLDYHDFKELSANQVQFLARLWKISKKNNVPDDIGYLYSDDDDADSDSDEEMEEVSIGKKEAWDNNDSDSDDDLQSDDDAKDNTAAKKQKTSRLVTPVRNEEFMNVEVPNEEIQAAENTFLNLKQCNRKMIYFIIQEGVKNPNYKTKMDPYECPRTVVAAAVIHLLMTDPLSVLDDAGAFRFSSEQIDKLLKKARHSMKGTVRIPRGYVSDVLMRYRNVVIMETSTSLALGEKNCRGPSQRRMDMLRRRLESLSQKAQAAREKDSDLIVIDDETARRNLEVFCITPLPKHHDDQERTPMDLVHDPTVSTGFSSSTQSAKSKRDREATNTMFAQHKDKVSIFCLPDGAEVPSHARRGEGSLCDVRFIEAFSHGHCFNAKYFETLGHELIIDQPLGHGRFVREVGRGADWVGKIGTGVCYFTWSTVIPARLDAEELHVQDTDFPESIRQSYKPWSSKADHIHEGDVVGGGSSKVGPNDVLLADFSVGASSGRSRFNYHSGNVKLSIEMKDQYYNWRTASASKGANVVYEALHKFVCDSGGRFLLQTSKDFTQWKVMTKEEVRLKGGQGGHGRFFEISFTLLRRIKKKRKMSRDRWARSIYWSENMR